MDTVKGLVIAIIMAIVLFGTGAAAEIIGGFKDALGWGGALAGFFLVLALIFAGFNKD
jgi:hypothetical protein